MSKKEASLRAFIMGLILACVMLAANMYLALKSGLTVNASIPAAVVGLLTLRILFRSNSILEANIIQTMASAAESLAAGAVFTIPALYITEVWTSFSVLNTTLIVGLGGILGVLFMVLLRPSFVATDDNELIYPEGKACATLLQSGTDKTSLPLILSSCGLGGLYTILERFKIIPGSFSAGSYLGNYALSFGINFSPALVAIGYIIRWNIALLSFIGGLITWLLIVPYLGWGELAKEQSVFQAASKIWSNQGRYTGAGAMLVGGIWTIVLIRSQIIEATKKLWSKASVVKEQSSVEISTGLWWALVLATSLILLLYFVSLTDTTFQGVVAFLAMLPAAFFFVAVSSYICGLVGSSSNPVSGMTIVTICLTAVVLWLVDISGEKAILACLSIAGVVCCAAATAGDISQDLKTGYLIGASPRAQQMVSIVAILVPALLVAPIFTLLLTSYGLADGGPNSLEAPQAALMAALANGFFGTGNLPWDLITLGALIALCFGVVDLFLAKKDYTFRTPIMPVAVGMYLPIPITASIFLGGMIHLLVNRQGKKLAKDEPGILISSGLIAGEALMGVALAIPLFF